MRYSQAVTRTVRRGGIALAVYGGLHRAHVLRLLPRCRAASFPQQDKQYLVAVVQLPPASSLERTEAVMRAIGKIALDAAGRHRRAVQFAGLSTNGFDASSSSAHRVLQARRLRRSARRRSSSAGPSRGALNAEVRAHPGSVRRRVPAAAGAAAWARSAASSSTSRTARTSGAEALYAGDAGSRSARRTRTRSSPACSSSYQINVPQLDGERGSREGQAAGREADRRLPDDAGVSRLAVRERLQPLRTHLPGRGAGGCAVPRADGRHPAAEDAQRRRRDGAARLADHDRGIVRPGRRRALQRLSVRGHQRRAGAGLQLGRGAGRDLEDPRRDAAERHDVTSGPSSRISRSCPATRRCWCFRCAWCSCSWCWPRSTRASRCRSRSC